MLVTESLSRDILRILIWYPVRWLIRMLPVSTALHLFAVMGQVHRRLRPGSVRSVITNIRRAFPHADEKRIRDILSVYLTNHYIDRLHIFLYPRLAGTRNLDRVCSISGLDHLDRALAGHRGAIIVLGHYGPIQVPLFALGRKGYDLLQIGLPTDEGLSWIGRHVAFRLRMKYESMIPARILSADRFLRPVFQHLRNNGVVMMNIDPAGGGRWIGTMAYRPFLGAAIPFPTGSAALAAKSGAPILPLRIHRISAARYRFEIDPPIPSENTPIPGVIDRLADWYEEEVRADPGLWHFWDEFAPGMLIPVEPSGPGTRTPAG